MTDGTHNETPGLAQPGVLTLNTEPYLQFLDETGWTEDEKRAFIQELWQIIVGFVDSGFGISPIQQASKALEVDSPGVLALENNSSDNSFESVASDKEAAGRVDSWR